MRFIFNQLSVESFTSPLNVLPWEIRNKTELTKYLNKKSNYSMNLLVVTRKYTFIFIISVIMGLCKVKRHVVKNKTYLYTHFYTPAVQFSESQTEKQIKTRERSLSQVISKEACLARRPEPTKLNPSSGIKICIKLTAYYVVYGVNFKTRLFISPQNIFMLIWLVFYH